MQAQKFGARLAIARSAAGLDCSTNPYVVTMEDGQRVSGRSVIVASGARYRRLDVPDYARFEGQGIHYAATAMESNLCAGEEVLVVGGGNSAGQAAVFLSRTVRHLHILVRSRGLAETMSDYLVQRILSSNRITLHTHCQVTAPGGRRLSAPCDLDQREDRRGAAPRHQQHVRDDRRTAQYRLARWLPGARRQGLRADRRGRARMRHRPMPRASRASSRSAMSAPDRSSASPRAWARDRWWCHRSTDSCTRWSDAGQACSTK